MSRTAGEQTNTTMTTPNDEVEEMAATNYQAKGMAASNEEGQWSQKDMLTLLETMKYLLPCQDSTNFKTTESHLDWSKLAFKNYTGSMCHQKWTEISNKVRKFRTLTELIQEAEEHVKNPSKVNNLKKHADFPKKPRTPYFCFLMEKRAKYAKLYPEISNLDLTRILSKKYKELPEEKKIKYIQDFQRGKQDFERNLARFREEHLSLGQSIQNLDIPEKPKTPQQLWYDHKKTVYLKLKPDASTKDVKDALGKQWSQLSDKKRLKWIHKSLKQQKLYENKMRELIQKHPEVNIPEEDITCSTLTKAERQLKDKFDGRPTKPPPNSYAMYCAELRANMKDGPKTEHMSLCSQQWKLLSQQDKDAYQKKFEQKKEEYQLELMCFLKTLPEEEQQRVLAEERMVGLNKKVLGSHASKLEAQDAAKGKDKPGKPDERKALEETDQVLEPAKTAEEFWQQSVIGEYLARCNNDKAEALKSMETTWINMKKKDKIIWIKKAAQDYKRYERELSNIKSASAKISRRKKVTLQEPEKGPVQSSQEGETHIKMIPSKRKSTTKLKGPKPKTKAASPNKSNEKEEVKDDIEQKGNDDKSGSSSSPWSSGD